MDSHHFAVNDDSGFLALVDPDAYRGFVDENWERAQLLERFEEQTRLGRLLIWETGEENRWRVRVALEPVDVAGYAEIAGTIVSTEGRLLLTSYDSLTMAAQFEDVTLPEPRERNQVMDVEPGTYRCRIIQLHDHAESEEADSALADAEVHYVVELLRSETMPS
jgi:hypothetical protein